MAIAGWSSLAGRVACRRVGCWLRGKAWRGEKRGTVEDEVVEEEEVVKEEDGRILSDAGPRGAALRASRPPATAPVTT